MIKKVLLIASSAIVFVGCGGSLPQTQKPLPLKPTVEQMQHITADNYEDISLNSIKAIFGNSINPTANTFNARLAGDKNVSKKPQLRVALDVTKFLKVTSQTCDSGSVDVDEINKDLEYKLTFNNCTFSKEDIYGNSQKYTYNGIIELKSLGNNRYEEKFDHLSIKTEDNQEFDIEESTIYIDDNTHTLEFKNMYAKFNAGSFNSEYLNMNISIKVLSNNNLEYNINGYIKLCNGKYVYVKSDPTVTVESDNSYSTGILKISYSEETYAPENIKVIYDADSVTIEHSNDYNTIYSYSQYYEKLLNSKCQ